MICTLIAPSMSSMYFSLLSDYPGAPEAPVISEIFKESCVATYEPPQNDGGTPITGYHLERRIISSARWVRLSRNAIAELTYKVTELIEGNEYEFRVAAENKVGMGPFSPPSKPITAKDPWGRFFMHFQERGVKLSSLILILRKFTWKLQFSLKWNEEMSKEYIISQMLRNKKIRKNTYNYNTSALFTQALLFLNILLCLKYLYASLLFI